MDYKNIGELIKTVSESQITCFEIETEGIKIKMEKKEQQVVVERMPVKDLSVENVTQNQLTKENTEVHEEYAENLENNVAKTTENLGKTVSEENIFVIKSPIVGTMYTSPSAESKDFVKVGSKVKVGDTLCILEAMKLKIGRAHV